MMGQDMRNTTRSMASELSVSDRELRAAGIARMKARKLAADEERRALEAFEGTWAAGEPERKRHYIEKGLIEALEALPEVDLPAIIWPSFTLAGTGGGAACHKAAVTHIVERRLDAS